MAKIIVHYKLVGAVQVDVPNDKVADMDYLQKLVDDGEITDKQLIAGIESTDAWGIDGDAIEVFASSTVDGETLVEANTN